MYALTGLKGKKVALLGGAGFIGHNLALRLRELEAEVHVLDSLQVNNLGAFTSGLQESFNRRLYIMMINERLNIFQQTGIFLHIVDVRDYSLVSRHISSIEPDVVIHLAAIAHSNRANKDPYSTFDHSMRTLENALDASRASLPHFIYFSSSMVYGNFQGAAVTEETPCNPIGIYGALKLSGEKIVIAYNQVFGLPYTIIRPSALYGERCVSRRVGQAFIENALIGKPITVNGDGSDALDFTYIKDLVEGVVLCIQRPESRNQIFNITYGQARTLNELAEILREAFPGVPMEHNPRSALMPERGTLSIAKAQELLGYRSQWPIERGFRNYVGWYQQLYAESPELFVPAN